MAKAPIIPDDTWNRRWTTDAHGNRVLYGLTVEETEFHEAFVAWLNLPKAERNKLRREMHPKSNRFQQLHDKHEAARLEAVLVEIEVTETKPPHN